MTNYEKYKIELLAMSSGERCGFIRSKVLKKDCTGMTCSNCAKLTAEWLKQEYEESAIDWSKVEVDTMITVSDDGEEWFKRYFCKYENSKVHAWLDGATSWSDGHAIPKGWNYAKLAETIEL